MSTDRATGETPDSSPAIRITLLGDFDLAADGETQALPRRAHRLLALLALRPPGIGRDEAAALLTPQHAEEAARCSLRGTLGLLRATRLPLLAADGDVLRLAPRVVVDVRDAEEMARSGAVMSIPGAPDHRKLELLRRWTDPWVEAERERLRGLFGGALEDEARACLSRGDEHAGWLAGAAAVHVDPLRESAARILLRDRMRRGHWDLVLSTYEILENVLWAARGVEPSPETQAVMGPILDSPLRRRRLAQRRASRARRRRGPGPRGGPAR